MDPTLGNAERLPAPFEPDRQPRLPSTPVSPAAQQGTHFVFYPVFIDREAPRAVDQPATIGQSTTSQPSRTWKYTQLGFVASTMAGGGVLYGLGHPAEAVVSLLIGLGLGAVKVVRKLAD